MKDIRESSRFRRDLRRMRRRGKDLSKLYAVVETLARGEELDPRHRCRALRTSARILENITILDLNYVRIARPSNLNSVRISSNSLRIT